MTTARQVAVQSLLAVNTQGGYSNLVLTSNLNKAQLTKQDNAFAAVLFYGVLERMLTLDYAIRHYTKKPMKKLTPAVAEILRTAFYQLLYLKNIPPSAVVNESVSLTRTNRCASASGFVNGVLRSFLRDGAELPPLKGSPEEKLSVTYSCPVWIVHGLIQDYGREAAEKTLESFLGRPDLYARVNTLQTTTAQLGRQLEEQGIQWIEQEVEACISLKATGSLEELKAFQEGLFYIQDKSCQLAVQVLSPKKGERVLDACAAPGSKSFTMAMMMENQGEIISCDIHQHKLGLIAQGAERLGISIIHPMLNDGSVFNPELGEFDRVLCDVPCSGLGVMGKKPEIRYKKQEELEGLSSLQYKILENSAQYCKVGGTVMYSTCTLSKEENQQVAERFLQENPQFEPLEHPLHSQGWQTTMLPYLKQTDGFFFATMKRISK